MSDQIDVNEIANTLQTKIDLPDGVSQSDCDFVVAWKTPTSSDPTWYRLYRSGWVEQGGIYKRNSTGTFYLTLPIEMADTNYTALMTCAVKNRTSDFTSNWTFAPYSTTQCQIYSNGTVYSDYGWIVSGMSATS